MKLFTSNQIDLLANYFAQIFSHSKIRIYIKEILKLDDDNLNLFFLDLVPPTANKVDTLIYSFNKKQTLIVSFIEKYINWLSLQGNNIYLSKACSILNNFLKGNGTAIDNKTLKIVKIARTSNIDTNKLFSLEINSSFRSIILDDYVNKRYLNCINIICQKMFNLLLQFVSKIDKNNEFKKIQVIFSEIKKMLNDKKLFIDLNLVGIDSPINFICIIEYLCYSIWKTRCIFEHENISNNKNVIENRQLIDTAIKSFDTVIKMCEYIKKGE